MKVLVLFGGLMFLVINVKNLLKKLSRFLCKISLLHYNNFKILKGSLTNIFILKFPLAILIKKLNILQFKILNYQSELIAIVYILVYNHIKYYVRKMRCS